MKRAIPAHRLRQSMVARKWSKADLARAAGIDQDTVARALDPEQEDLTLQTESKIAAALGQHPVDGATAAGLRELTDGDGTAA